MYLSPRVVSSGSKVTKAKTSHSSLLLKSLLKDLKPMTQRAALIDKQVTQFSTPVKPILKLHTVDLDVISTTSSQKSKVSFSFDSERKKKRVIKAKESRKKKEKAQVVQEETVAAHIIDTIEMVVHPENPIEQQQILHADQAPAPVDIAMVAPEETAPATDGGDNITNPPTDSEAGYTDSEAQDFSEAEAGRQTPTTR